MHRWLLPAVMVVLLAACSGSDDEASAVTSPDQASDVAAQDSITGGMVCTDVAFDQFVNDFIERTDLQRRHTVWPLVWNTPAPASKPNADFVSREITEAEAEFPIIPTRQHIDRESLTVDAVEVADGHGEARITYDRQPLTLYHFVRDQGCWMLASVDEEAPR